MANTIAKKELIIKLINEIKLTDLVADQLNLTTVVDPYFLESFKTSGLPIKFFLFGIINEHLLRVQRTQKRF